MTSPRTTPAVKVLLSHISVIADAPHDGESMGLGLGAIASITETVPPPGGEATYVGGSTSPGSRSHPMISTAIAWMMCAINVWRVMKELSREGVALIASKASNTLLMNDAPCSPYRNCHSNRIRRFHLQNEP